MEAEWDSRDPVAETRWLHALHDATGWPHAMVGQAWLGRDDAAAVLAGHAAFPLVRSVRQKPAAAASPEAMVPGAPGSVAAPGFRSGYRLPARPGGRKGGVEGKSGAVRVGVGGRRLLKK